MLRPRTLAILAASGLALYSLIGFLAVPYIIKHHVVPAAAEQIRHPVSVKEAAFNPFTLSLTIEGFEVQEPDGTPLLGFEQLFINIRAKSLFLQTYAFNQIRLVMPFVSMKVAADGKMNLLELVPPAEPETIPTKEKEARAGGTSIVPVEIGQLSIERGIVEFRDESKPKPFELSIVPIQISLRNFTTVRGGENAYAFTAEIGKGESLAWEGRVSLEPAESEGKLSLTGVHLTTLYGYAQNQVGFDVRQGRVSVGGRYHVDLNGPVPNIIVTEGTVSVTDLAIGDKGPEAPVITIPSVAIDGVDVDLLKKRMTVAKVQSADARLETWVNPDGMLNYQRLFLPPPTAAAPVVKPTEGALSAKAAADSWAVEVKEVALSNYRAVYEDRTLARPSHLEVDGLDVTVKGFKLPLQDPLAVDARLMLNQTGRIGAKGSVTVDPLSVDLDLNLKEIGLHAFQPYLDPLVDVDLRGGALDLGGKLHFMKEHGRKPLLTFQGDLAVNRLSITDRREFDELLSLKRLGLNRVALEVEPTSIRAGEVILQEPVVSLVLQPDGTLNLAQLAKPSPPEASAQAAKPAPPHAPGKQPAPLTAAIDVVKVANASGTFQDLAIRPTVKVGITELTGTIKGLSSRELAKADVALTGKVNRSGALKITGQINPLSGDAYTDLSVKFENVDLSAASPYAGTYVGYPIAKGKLFLDLTYKIAKKDLAGENKVLIDQLTFGDKTESLEATSLPVLLAVALLKDRKGQIEVDLPVRGNLDDPDFRYGRVLWNAVLNLLGKVATSPLSLVGALVGGSGEDLQTIEFPAARSEWTEAEAKKLTTLATVLTERPGLSLDIMGMADRKIDGRALAEEEFRRNLFQLKQQESGKPARGAAAETVLLPEEEARLIGAWFARQFPLDETSDKPIISPEVKKERLLGTLVIEEAALRLLAQERGQRIRDWLVQHGQIDQARIFLVEPALREGSGTTVPTDLKLAAH